MLGVNRKQEKYQRRQACCFRSEAFLENGVHNSYLAHPLARVVLTLAVCFSALAGFTAAVSTPKSITVSVTIPPWPECSVKNTTFTQGPGKGNLSREVTFGALVHEPMKSRLALVVSALTRSPISTQKAVNLIAQKWLGGRLRDAA